MEGDKVVRNVAHMANSREGYDQKHYSSFIDHNINVHQHNHFSFFENGKKKLFWKKLKINLAK
jgi:hypothetical protein